MIHQRSLRAVEVVHVQTCWRVGWQLVELVQRRARQADGIEARQWCVTQTATQNLSNLMAT